MKNRINLYLDEFKPRLQLVSLNFLFVVWGILLISIILFYLQVQIQRNKAEQQSAIVANVHSQKSALIKQLSIELEQRISDPQLVKQIEQLQADIAVKKTILTEISGRENLKHKRFSALMHDLAAHHAPDLWLTGISVDQHKLLIEGSTVDATSLPRWLNKLRNVDYFVDQEFANAQLFRDTDQQLNFILSSEPLKVDVKEPSGEH